ncbi:sigma-54-dependent Fis family transcriptional regulator [Rhodococcus pseudokoreensis]|uniref:sigma-54-dependent Fis family transcriptional regulator n=1 Tax=Rhodococcus pseudokoreensis TaxID=2811421 RepID=UPI001F12869E|nr:helix-turn-helix domain-containing protein [Rhodococcus pseudokoreensis]
MEPQVRSSRSVQDRGSGRPEIAESWKRSAFFGLHPASNYDVKQTSEIDSSSRLRRAAEPVLAEMQHQLTGTEFGVILADPKCRIVATLFGGSATERRLLSSGALLGSSFAEDRVGTNAIGTTVELRHGIVIHSDEHFLDQFKGFSCYGHPIVHPVTRRVEGVLEMTGIGARANPMFVPFMTRAASDIEKGLIDGVHASQQLLIDAFQRVSSQNTIAVSAIGEDIFLSNRVALDLLQMSDHATLRAVAADLRPNQQRTVRIQLSSGEEALVRAEGVAGTDCGAVFVIRSDRRTTNPIRRAQAPSSSAHERSQSDLARLRDLCDPVAISGEPGTGRTTAVRKLANGSTTVCVDAATIAFEGADSWAERLIAAKADTTAKVLVVENVQLIPDSLLPLMVGLVEAVGGPRVVVTSTPTGDLPPGVAGLVGRCPGQVLLPPLSQRTREFADIAQSLLNAIEPGLILSFSAVEALASRDWPGNLAELAVVLRTAACRRSSSRIAVADLPEKYRVAPRVAGLGGRARAEREAIIDALEECGGNKVHAANLLGISRSTIYLRIRALKITLQ